MIKAFGVCVLVGALGIGCGPPRALQIASESTLTNEDLSLSWSDSGLQQADDFAEQLKILVTLDGGGTAYTRLRITNLARADGRADIKGNVDLPDGRKFGMKARKSRGEWTFDGDRLNATVAGNTLRVGVGSATVRLEDEDLILQYQVTSTLGAMRPVGGAADFGGAFYMTTVPIPRGRVEGTLTIKGSSPPEVIPIRGVAYVEHRVTDLAPYKMARSWLRIQDVGAEQTVILSIFQRTKRFGGQLQGWAMIADDEGVQLYEGDLLVRPVGWRKDPKTPYKTPAVVFLEARERGRFRGVVKLEDITERRDDLAKLSGMERFVVKRVMKPWTYRFDDAAYLFKLAVGGEVERPFRGRLRFEYQQFNP